jgi:DNA repair protein REV1
MKLSAFFSGKQDGTCNQGDRNDVNKDLGLQTSSAQEGSQDQNVFRENEGSLMSVEVAEDSLSPDEHEVSTLEERDGEDFAMDDDDNVCETEISESVNNDMDTKLYVPDSPDATSDVCGTNSVGSHLSLGLLEKDTAKSATRSHSTLTDPNFVENYFKACYPNNLASFSVLFIFLLHNCWHDLVQYWNTDIEMWNLLSCKKSCLTPKNFLVF